MGRLANVSPDVDYIFCMDTSFLAGKPRYKQSPVFWLFIHGTFYLEHCYNLLDMVRLSTWRCFCLYSE
jgi:hypothetical protein